MIFTFSSMPQQPRDMPPFPHADKLAHFIEYAILGFLIIRALYSTKDEFRVKNLRLIAVFLAILYGASDEFHQYFVPGRNMDILDLLSDGFGAYIGQLFYKLK